MSMPCPPEAVGKAELRSAETLGQGQASAVELIAHQFLLLGIDRDDRLTAPLERPDLAVDVLELRVAVGVILPLLRLAVGLQVIAGVLQSVRSNPTEPRHDHRAGSSR